MSHALGVYIAPEHSRQSDRDYISALQPPVIRILDPDVQQIADMHALAPNAIIAPRTWVIDDNNGAAKRALMADPVATGHDHAQQYAVQWDRWTLEAVQRGLKLPNLDRILFNSVNEPNEGGTPDKIAAYNVAFLEMCRINGIRAAALCLGVGWPDNTGPDTPVNWQPYANAGLFDAIARGQHWLELHEYFYKSGPQDGWRWLAGRHLQCPFDVPILLGEIGIDNFVDAQRWQREGGNRGWQGNVSPDVYAEMIEFHIRNSDRRVVAALPFITDYRSNAWESFDTAQAHNALLARKDRMVPQTAPPTHQPFETYLPAVSTGPTPSAPVAYVIAPAGLNLRAAPDGDILTAMPYGEQVQIVGVEQDGWLRVRYGRDEGYAAGMYISLQAPEPTPVVEPTPQPTDNFERCLRFVLKQEGGWADDPRDVGGATMKGVTIGTFTRWRQAHGQPVPSKDDLRNIGDAELYQIYKEWYWDASGSGSLSWPLCLMHFNIAVNAGPERAKQFLTQSNGNFLVYVATAMEWYTRIDGWQHFGAAWTRRNAAVLREAAK